MMCYGGKDLARSYRTVRANTLTRSRGASRIEADSWRRRDPFDPQLLTHISLTDSFSGVHKEKRTSLKGSTFHSWSADAGGRADASHEVGVIGAPDPRGEETASWIEGLSDVFSPTVNHHQA